MMAALRGHLVPRLRTKGFKGSFPHFRRIALPRVDYLTVQFYSAGGSFVVELASSDANGKPDGYGSDLPVEKLNVQFFRERFRLGSKGLSDHWFEFGPRTYDPPREIEQPDFYVRIAERVLLEFEGAGEQWLHSRRVAA
jgi:hypothetical protein